MEIIDHVPFDTGSDRLDLNLTLLRYSGSAWWFILGMMLIQEAVMYANGTEASSGQFLQKDSWVLGPELLAVARLLKRRDTDGCESKLDLRRRREIHDIGNEINVGLHRNGQQTVEVNASQLLALAELMKDELKNSDMPESLSDSLSPETIRKLFRNSNAEDDIQFSVLMDVDAGISREAAIETNAEYSRIRGDLSEALHAGAIEKAVEFGVSMLKHNMVEQTDSAHGIASFTGNNMVTSFEKRETVCPEQLTECFLSALSHVHEVTEDFDLMAEVMRNPDVLLAIERGFIRNNLMLKAMLDGKQRRHQKRRKASL